MPVDLSPIKGLIFNLKYPLVTNINDNDCGDVRDANTTPIIIEANEFQAQTQPGSSGHSWNCSTYLPNHTGTCYRAAVPITPHWGLSPLTNANVNQTPRITYNIWLPSNTNYYVWVCAMGGHVDDDSLHITAGNVPQVEPAIFATATDMTGYHSTNWVWQSARMNGFVPYLYFPRGYNYINLHMRENGLRVDRILLTTSPSYNPTTSNVRCGGQGL